MINNYPWNDNLLMHKSIILNQSDPTWELEYAHFKKLCTDIHEGNLDKDIQIPLS